MNGSVPAPACPVWPDHFFEARLPCAGADRAMYMLHIYILLHYRVRELIRSSNVVSHLECNQVLFYLCSTSVSVIFYHDVMICVVVVSI